MSLRLDHKYRPLTIARSLLGKWSCWSPGDSNRQTGPWPFAGRFSVDLKILPRPFSHFPPSRRKTARPTAFPNSTASQHATPTSAHSRVEITADKVKTSAVRFPHHLHGKVSGHDFQSCRKQARRRRFLAAAGRSWGLPSRFSAVGPAPRKTVKPHALPKMALPS